jgi:cytosine/adenosine deaminase-related metal-dependent hydrolase
MIAQNCPERFCTKKAVVGWWVLLAILLLSTQVWATTVTLGADSTKHVLKGTIITPQEVIDGTLVIEGDTITCVAVECTEPDGATIFTVTNAYIFPGFVDAHNHVAYNFLPKWTPPKLYIRRAQWQATPSYNLFKKPYDELKAKGLTCEIIKYGEIKALISGITTVQGTSPGSSCIRLLVRNAENQNKLNVSASHIRTYILDISSFRGTVNWNVTKSFVVHLAEGLPTDERSRREFAILKQKGLLKPQTAIIHGTAFGDAEFKEIADAGAKLIWSPQSNLALYNKTTDIKSALQHGILISLGVDWNPSGSDNIFDELRVAANVNQDEFDSIIPPSDWIKMITINPATALALDHHVGKLAPGLKADITVLKSKSSDPYESLLNSHLQDVQMVWVGGNLLYGNKPIVRKVKPGQCEDLKVYGSNKQICVRDGTERVPKNNQTLGTMKEILQQAYPGLAPLTP